MLKKFIFALILFPTLLFADEFKAGKDYAELPVAARQDGQPQLLEFFSYGCPACYRIEKPLEQWLATKKGTFRFERVPVVFHPEWKIYAKAYYIAKALSMSEKLSPLLFDAIQKNHQGLSTSKEMIDFFVAHGAQRELLESAFNDSTQITLEVGQGMQLMSRYQIRAVPAFIINGKYRTDGEMAGSPDRLFQVIDYLLKKK